MSMVEAKVTARDFTRAGTLIECLTGMMVRINFQEEELDHENVVFSIMEINSNVKFFHLGPASFINHNCEPNARLIASEEERNIYVNAIKDINPGEEITVLYGKSFFGRGNAEYLCMTYEKRGHGQWSPGTI